MWYAALAWLTVGIHATFILFVVFGGFLVVRRPSIALVHVPAVIWGAYVEFSGRICPLTPIENRLRALAGEAGYGQGFIEHYVLAAMYPDSLTVRMQCILGTCVLLVNGVAYLRLRRRRQP